MGWRRVILRWGMGGLVVLLVGGCRRPEPEPPAPPGPTPPTLTIPEALHAADLDELSLYDAPALADWRDREGQTAVHVAIHDGNLYLLDWLLRQHLDPCTPDSSGLTPLHRAVLDRRSEMVNRLLFESCDIDYRDHAWKTPAEYALELGYIDILERLAAAGADIELPSLDTPEEDTPEAAESQPRPQIRLEGDFRTWTSATGDTIEAEYVDLISDTLILRDRQGKEYRIHLFKLSRKDQILARQLQQGVTLISSKDLPATRTGSRSTADKLARRSGWAILEDCRLLPNPSNDGDSFHVMHDGREYIFRLYHVDTAETENTFPDRVREQALYFGITPREAIHYGNVAKKFTTKLLAGHPFTVATKWEDAMGSSDLQRFFAVVVTDQGELDELLTRAGLVRIYGKDIEGSIGRNKQRTLLQLEKAAQKDRAGAWADSDFAAASP